MARLYYSKCRHYHWSVKLIFVKALNIYCKKYCKPIPAASVNKMITAGYFSSVQLLSHVRLFATPWTAARQASLSITNSWSPPKPMFIESVMPSKHLILCRPLLLLPSIFPSIRVFSNESALRIRWPKYWRFSHQGSPHFILLLDLVLLGGGSFPFVFSSSFCFLSQQSTLHYMVTSFPSLSFLTLRRVRLFATPWTVVRLLCP